MNDASMLKICSQVIESSSTIFLHVLEAIHKWCHQNKGRGVKMSEVVTSLLPCRQRGRGSEKSQNLVEVIYGWPLTNSRSCSAASKSSRAPPWPSLTLRSFLTWAFRSLISFFEDSSESLAVVRLSVASLKSEFRDLERMVATQTINFVASHAVVLNCWKYLRKKTTRKKIKVPKNSRKIWPKTQRNGSYGSDLNFRTCHFLRFLCSNLASNPNLH